MSLRVGSTMLRLNPLYRIAVLRCSMLSTLRGSAARSRMCTMRSRSLSSSSPGNIDALEQGTGEVPSLAWTRRLDASTGELKEFKATVSEVLSMLGLFARLWKYTRAERAKGKVPPIDPFHRRLARSPAQGVPLGGIGGGSIGRSWKGDFLRWQMLPGTCEDGSVLANQFSMFTSRGSSKHSSVLYVGKQPETPGISSWNWNLEAKHCTYHGLFPRAWTTYDCVPDPNLKFTCRQISPFIPHNYKESSFPSCVFVYELNNVGTEDADVTILFSWANSIGGNSELSGGHKNSPFLEDDGVKGVLLHHAREKGSLTFAVAAKETKDVSVSICPSFVLSDAVPSGQTSASDMWVEIQEKGHFDDRYWNLSPASSEPGIGIGAAVAASVRVEACGKKTVVFGLAWDNPKAIFPDGNSYNRRYTKFFGSEGNSASKLVHNALTNYGKWEAAIEGWQAPILQDGSLPEWYRYTLFNELYYLVAGGTVWADGQPEKFSGKQVDVCEVPEQLLKAIEKHKLSSSWKFPLPYDEGVGRLLYLEGVEYLFWNTYDVHFYASYALLTLFPKLQLGLQRDFAAATLTHETEDRTFLSNGERGIRSTFGAVPHDLGTGDPWIKMNSYNFHNTDRWKDLNPKFVVQVYRDFKATGDLDFARAVWPAVFAALAYTEQFDRDGDGMIENDGFPDQTYDVWTTEGVSAYCGGLWAAALQAAASMAAELNDQASAKLFQARYIRARSAYEASLWNGSYFNYDAGFSGSSNSIQSDQLAGQWTSLSSGLPPLVDEDKAVSSLNAIFELNVMKLASGGMGAVNGMRPDGQVDTTSMQSREIWTGSTYALAALMIHQGLRDKAFKVAEGVYLHAWSESGAGYAFQTPEAWTTDGRYRSLAYMRPLAIWAMQWALSCPPPAPAAAPAAAGMSPSTGAAARRPLLQMDEEDGACTSEGFRKLSDALKSLSARPGSQATEPRFYSSVWTFMYDLIKTRLSSK